MYEQPLTTTTTSQAFSFVVPKNNDTSVSVFAAYLKSYLEQHQQQELDPDPYLNLTPKIRPFEGTVPQNPFIDELRIDDDGALLSIQNYDGDNSDDEGLGLLKNVWEPRQGKITIMTMELVKCLAQMTGCSFFPDHGSNSVGITGINSEQAVRKLANLERLQVCSLSNYCTDLAKMFSIFLQIEDWESHRRPQATFS